MTFIKRLFTKPAKRAEGFSEFFRRASLDEKKKVVSEAAKRANEDQRRLLEQSKARA